MKDKFRVEQVLISTDDDYQNLTYIYMCRRENKQIHIPIMKDNARNLITEEDYVFVYV